MSDRGDARLRRSAARERARELSRRLDEWDPIGVYRYDDGPPPGEYDCLLAPTMKLLSDGAEAVAIAAMFAQDLVDHFGLQPADPPVAFATELRAWWDTTTSSFER